MLVAVRSVIFRNKENGFSVAEVQEEVEKKVFVISGTFSSIRSGDRLRIRGEWYKHPEYGEQFRITEYSLELPDDRKSMINFLSSGFIPGVRKKLASLIVNYLGEDAIKKIQENENILLEVPGIGEKRAALIRKALSEQQSLKELSLFFSKYELPFSLAARVHKKYGSESINIIKNNPYRLAEEVWGIGFLTADKIASHLGFQKDHPERIKAGLNYILSKSQEDGNVFLPKEILISNTAALLDVSKELCKDSLEELCYLKKLIQEKEAIYFPSLWYAEEEIATELNKRLGGFLNNINSIDDLLKFAQEKNKIELNEDQIKAIKEALENRIFIITGGPGTGKTTILKCLLEIYDCLNVKYLLAAPTGRAAKRLEELTLHPAKTIHRLLEYSPEHNRFLRNAQNILKAHSIIIDEASMIDIQLFHAILQAMHPSAQLILIGDKDQLPSVGPGEVLKDLIESNKIPCSFLKKIYRQAENSLIIQGAHLVNNGSMPYMITKKGNKGDFYFIPCKDKNRSINLLIKIIKEKIPKLFKNDSIRDIQIISPMYKGISGIDNLNQVLQEALNPLNDNKKSLGKFREGDKVMQVKNNYEKNIFNGEIGYIKSIDEDNKKIFVNYYDNVTKYENYELEEITLAYAISAHKAEGSEFDLVIILLFREHRLMLYRNWLYTAISRAKKMLIIIGEEEALKYAIDNTSSEKRYTMLKDRILNIGDTKRR